MSTMVERVAKVLCAAEYGDPEATYFDRPLWKNYAAKAREIIKEMREPTEGMTDAGNVPTYQWVDDTAERVWSRMIDAALKESGE